MRHNRGMKTYIAIFGLFLLSASTGVLPKESDCGAGAHLEQVQCAGGDLQALEAELEKLYRATLAKLPDDSKSDKRKGKPQLERAQQAWLEYRDEHCNFIGGIQGGSTLSVTDFATQCAIEETRNRIRFFENVPWGDH